jgi:paraquat-inducible protein B
MSTKSNPTLIGAFVVGATVLLAAGVAVFGGAQLFAKRDVYIAYFAEKTQGLRVGSNVTMNGAHIGSVSEMVLLVNRDTYESTTAVTIDILPESWVVTEGGTAIGSGLDSSIPHEELINVGGLRAHLQSESLVTGQLLIDMTFQPETRAVMRGGANPPYPEIPTVPSNIQQIMTILEKVILDLAKDFDGQEASEGLQSIIRGVDELANSQELRESLAGANRIINQQETQQLSATLQATLKELRSAAADAGTLLRHADSDLKPVVERITATLGQAEQALAAASIQLRGESAEVYQLDKTLREVEGAARSMREVLDYLERNPEAILQGKKP